VRSAPPSSTATGRSRPCPTRTRCVGTRRRRCWHGSPSRRSTGSAGWAGEHTDSLLEARSVVA
jgi:hypothetical protein